MITRHRGRWTPAERAEAIYRYLPFDVPPNAAGVTVTLGYDRDRGVLDLGLVDPERFRGWSGGERSQVSVTPGAATPGYLPGKLPVGAWSVMLSLHRVPVEGLDYEVTIEIGLGDTRSTSASPAPPAAAAASRCPGRRGPAMARR